MSTKISLRIPDELLNPIDNLAADWYINRSEVILKLLRDGLKVQSASSILERIEALEKEVSEIKSSKRPTPVRQFTGDCPTPVRQHTSERPTPVRQSQDGISKSRPLPIEGQLLHPRECAALLDLKYPSGWEGLTHRHGTDFERDGYRFVRSDQKQSRAFLWSVSQLAAAGQIDTAID